VIHAEEAHRQVRHQAHRASRLASAAREGSAVRVGGHGDAVTAIERVSLRAGSGERATARNRTTKIGEFSP